MTEATVFTRRNGGNGDARRRAVRRPACVAGRLAWPDSNGYTNPIRYTQVRVSVRSGHARRFATPVEPRSRRTHRCRGLLRSSPLLRSSALNGVPCLLRTEELLQRGENGVSGIRVPPFVSSSTGCPLATPASSTKSNGRSPLTPRPARSLPACRPFRAFQPLLPSPPSQAFGSFRTCPTSRMCRLCLPALPVRCRPWPRLNVPSSRSR